MEHGCTSGILTRRLFISRVHLCALCEELTGLGIASLLVFGPWAFGSTQPWAIWTLNVGSYFLGVLLLIKLMLRRVGSGAKSRLGEAPWVCALVGLQAAILLYCLISALNPRATWNPSLGVLSYRQCIPWLPHSLDSVATWKMFWRLLASICFFWSVCDWLGAIPQFTQPSGRSRRWRRPGDLSNTPRRLGCLLTVLTVSGGLLAMEGIVQRLAQSPKLLFVLQPQMQPDPFTQFASYAYRGNAAQYFNLLWPVSFTFVALSSAGSFFHRWQKQVLMVCAGAMSAAPIISGARGAALASLAMLVLLVPVALGSGTNREGHRVLERTRSGLMELLTVVAFVGLSAALCWSQLRPRLNEWSKDLNAREQLYVRARLITRDYPLFGTGPGTFERVYGFYRSTPNDEWPAQLHNDWLETRITFGWLGSTLIACAFGVVLVRWFIPGPFRIDQCLVFSIWLVLAGCLVQARLDFPLQISSIALLFTFWCAVLFSLSQAS